eukprot:s358_g15.t1
MLAAKACHGAKLLLQIGLGFQSSPAFDGHRNSDVFHPLERFVICRVGGPFCPAWRLARAVPPAEFCCWRSVDFRKAWSLCNNMWVSFEIWPKDLGPSLRRC